MIGAAASAVKNPGDTYVTNYPTGGSLSNSWNHLLATVSAAQLLLAAGLQGDLALTVMVMVCSVDDPKYC